MAAAVHTKDRFRIEQGGGSLGAHVVGLALARADGEEIGLLRQALLDHLVVALPEQTLSLADLERLTDRLGGCDVTPFVKPMEGHPFVIRILKEPHEKLNFANAWHTDLSYLPAPPSFTILYCLEAPPQGATPSGPTSTWRMRRSRRACARRCTGWMPCTPPAWPMATAAISTASSI